MFENHGADCANYENQLHSLAEADAELQRLKLCAEDRMLLKQDGALTAINMMRAAVMRRRAQLVEQGVIE